MAFTENLERKPNLRESIDLARQAREEGVEALAAKIRNVAAAKDIDPALVAKLGAFYSQPDGMLWIALDQWNAAQPGKQSIDALLTNLETALNAQAPETQPAFMHRIGGELALCVRTNYPHQVIDRLDDALDAQCIKAGIEVLPRITHDASREI